MDARQLLYKDAGNRAHRAFLQGLAIDVALAVAIVAYNLASTPDDELSWYLIGASLLRTAVQSGAAYVMRAFVDPSRVPTPLPPRPQPAPAELVDGTEVREDDPGASLLHAAHPHPGLRAAQRGRHRNDVPDDDEFIAAERERDQEGG